MMRITRIFQILILVFYLHMAPSSHFQGGTITYKIVNVSGSIVSIMITQTYLYRWPVVYCDNARILSQSAPNASFFPGFYYNLSCVSNCTTTGGYQPVPVQTYCTDYSSAMAISVTQRTDIVNLTSGAYFTVAFVSYAMIDFNVITYFLFDVLQISLAKIDSANTRLICLQLECLMRHWSAYTTRYRQIKYTACCNHDFTCLYPFRNSNSSDYTNHWCW